MKVDNKYFDRLMDQEYNPNVKNMNNYELIQEVLRLVLNKEDVNNELEKFLYEYENSEKGRKQLNVLIGIFEHHHELKKEKKDINLEIKNIDQEILNTENEIKELKKMIREKKKQEEQ